MELSSNLSVKAQKVFKAVYNREFAKDGDETRAFKCASEKAGATIENLPTEDTESRVNKEKLSQSCVDEANAAADYRARADLALSAGDTESAALYEHIAAERDGHYDEFAGRLQGMSKALKALKAAFVEEPSTPEVKTYAVKFFDEEKGIVEGLGVPYGGPLREKVTDIGKDLQAEWFDGKTNFASERYDGKAVKSMPELYHHGLDAELKDAPIGKVIEVTDTPEGKWFKTQLDTANRYYERIKMLVKLGKLKFSSGAFADGVVKSLEGHIENWPLKEISLTPYAANPMADTAFKSLLETPGITACKENKSEVSMPTKKAVKAEEKPVAPLEPEKKPEDGKPAPVEAPVAEVPEDAKPEAAKHFMKCATCGKAIQLPQPVTDALNALVASAQDILSGGDGSGEAAQDAPPEAAPSQPAESQGMSPENHPAPPVPAKVPAAPVSEAVETPKQEAAEPPAEQTPEEEKKPVKTVTPEAVKSLIDEAVAKAIKGVEEAVVKPLKERIETLEKQPVKGPPLRDVKAVTNERMGENAEPGKAAFYDALLKDPNISASTRMEIARKSAEDSINDVFAAGPKSPRHN
jgi:hypothetical protein